MSFQQNKMPAAPPPIAPIESREYLHTSIAGALLPFMQATITAVIVFITVLFFAWAVFDVMDPWIWAGSIAIIAWFGVWALRLWQWLILTAEKATGIDFNQDGVIGEKPVVRIQLNQVKDNAHYQSSNIDLPITHEQLVALAQGLLGGVPFSEKKWAGADHPFSSNEFRSLRSVMLSRGLIEPVNEKDVRQGFKLTREGRAVMQYFASPSPTEAKADDEIE